MRALLVLAVLAAGLFAPITAAAARHHAGYVFFYFTGEGTAAGEQVYLAAGRGTVLPVTRSELDRVRAGYP